MKPELLLTFNAGSSTVKIGLFEINATIVRRMAKGVIDFHREPLSFRVTEGPVTFEVDLVVVQTLEVEPIRGLEVALDHAASTAFQISGAVLYLMRSLSSLN
jgi:hypothetical protein